MVNEQAIKAEGDYKRITFLRAAARASWERDARAHDGRARMRPAAGLGVSPAGATASGRATRVRYLVWGWIGGLLGRPAWDASGSPTT